MPGIRQTSLLPTYSFATFRCELDVRRTQTRCPVQHVNRIFRIEFSFVCFEFISVFIFSHLCRVHLVDLFTLISLGLGRWWSVSFPRSARCVFCCDCGCGCLSICFACVTLYKHRSVEHFSFFFFFTFTFFVFFQITRCPCVSACVCVSHL